MIGGFNFKLESKRLHYSFVLNRKITKIAGDSATGKSTLVSSVADSLNPRNKIQMTCEYQCSEISEVFTSILFQDIHSLKENYKNRVSYKKYHTAMRELLSKYDNRVYFCDETFRYLPTYEFAAFCKFTDSFFVICCRDKLDNLPYSFTEIYSIISSGKYHKLEKVYDSFLKIPELQKNTNILIEDSNSGFQFFNKISDYVDSANGKSNITDRLLNKHYDIIVADGAAIGSEISDITATLPKNTILFLLESFEYIILCSEMFSNFDISDKLYHTEKYATGLYFSWERYYTELIEKLTSNKKYSYSKTRLNPCYYEKCCDNDCELNKISNKTNTILNTFHYTTKR